MLEKTTDGLCHLPTVTPEQYQVILDALVHYKTDYEGKLPFEKRPGLLNETWEHIFYNTKRTY